MATRPQGLSGTYPGRGDRDRKNRGITGFRWIDNGTYNGGTTPGTFDGQTNDLGVTLSDARP